MSKATKPLPRARATRKPLLKLSPIGRELLTAFNEHQALIWIDPQSGHLSPELAKDERFQAAYERERERQRRTVNRLTTAIMKQPLSLSNLADRALVHREFLAGGEDVAPYLPGRKCKPDDEDWQYYMPAIAGIVGMSDIPRRLPHEGFDRTNGPPDAEARIRKLLGKHRPKRTGLPPDVAKRIGDDAAKAAVANAEAEANIAPVDAPLFSERVA